MSLSDPTSGAGYAFGEVLTSSDMTTIATQQPAALDGNAGGTYAPSAAIIVNGSGLTIGGSGLTVGGDFTLKYGAVDAFVYDSSTGTMTIKAFTATGSNVFSDECDFSNYLVVTASGTLYLSAGGTVDDRADHTVSGGGVWEFTSTAGTLTVDSGAGKWTLNNDVELANTTTLSGGTSVTAPATLSGSGQVVWRYHVAADSGSQTFTANQYDEIDCSAQSAPHSWSLTNTGAVTGSRIRFVNAPANAVTLTVTTLGSVVLKSNTTGNYLWIEFVFDGTQWQRSIYDQIP